MSVSCRSEAEAVAETAFSLVAEGAMTESGGVVTGTATSRKLIFQGRQTHAYRLIHCVLDGAVTSRDQVVRHRCHNLLCVSPRHLQ